MKHKLQEVWEESGWAGPYHPVPEFGLSEGKLCIDTWNAAIKAAADCVIIDGNPAIALEKINALHYEEAVPSDKE